MKSLSEHCDIITIWPISQNDLPRWIQAKLQSKNITADQSAIQMLAHFTEGNLLATHQAINKLSLISSASQITMKEVREVIHDCARFNVFDFIEFAMLGQTRKSLRALNQLQMSGTEPTLILWALSKEIRLLHQIQFLKSTNQQYQNVINSQWKSRQRTISIAASRLSLSSTEEMLQQCHDADKSIKGLSNNDCWLILEKITLLLSQQNKALT